VNPDATYAIKLEKITVTYNVFESIITIFAGGSAGLISLLGFGIDSGIEMITALLVLRHLTATLNGRMASEETEKRLLKIIALTFFALSGFLIIDSMHKLLTNSKPESSFIGLCATAFSVLFMPWLAKRKLNIGQKIGSSLLIADAAETKLCGWLALSTFTGLLAFHFLHLAWLDSATSLIIAVFAVNEGREAWEGELVCEDD